MSLAEILGFRHTKPEQLIEKARSLGRDLRGHKNAKRVLEVAAGYEHGIEGRKRWRSWRNLIGVHEQCERQLRALRSVNNLLKEVDKARLDDEQRSEFFNSFSHMVQNNAETELADELRELERSWLRVRVKVKEVAPNVSVTHAFLMLSDLSGVEVASLVVGGLVGLGAIYTWAFYEAAIGMSVLGYFTWEDFTYQGLRVLLEIAVALGFLETLFWAWRAIRRRSSVNGAFAAHRWVLRRPGVMVAGVVAFMTVLTFCSGWLFGRVDRARFFEKDRCSLELATVLDGSILKDVYLVGTTSRTATFLQARDQRDSSFPGTAGEEACADEVSQSLGLRLREFLVAFGAVVRSPIQDPKEWEGRDAAFSDGVLIMDRALVVCHAKGNACREQGRRPPDRAATEAVADLAKRLDDLARSEELEKWKRDVDQHLNRHHDQVRALLGAPGGAFQ